MCIMRIEAGQACKLKAESGKDRNKRRRPTENWQHLTSTARRLRVAYVLATCESSRMRHCLANGGV